MWRMIVLQIKFYNRGTILIASIIGELDHHSAEYIRQKIDNEMIKSTNKNIIFDFTNLSFMDSPGIGVIMGRYKNVQRLYGKMAIVNTNDQIDRILEMAGIKKIIPVFDKLDVAIKALQQSVR